MLEVSGFWMVLAVGCFGGVLAEAWRWYKIRESPNLPSYLKSPVYWIITLIMILGGGILSSFYGTENVNAFLVLNIGASAPLIVSALASTTPPVTIPPAKTLAPGTEHKEKRARELIPDFLSWR